MTLARLPLPFTRTILNHTALNKAIDEHKLGWPRPVASGKLEIVVQERPPLEVL